MNLPFYARRFGELSPSDRRLFVQAEFLFVLILLGLKTIGFRRCHNLLGRVAGRCATRGAVTDVPSVAQCTVTIVRVAARHTMGNPNCLSQSLVCWTLLRRQGIQSVLQIGTRRENGKFEAHAWVEYDGRVLNDRPDVRQQFAAFNQPIEAAQFVE